MGRAEEGRDRPLRRSGVDRDHDLRSRGPGTLDGIEPDSAGPDHDDGGAGWDVDPVQDRAHAR